MIENELISLTFKKIVMKKYLLPIVFILSIQFGFSQERNRHYNQHSNHHHSEFNNCNNYNLPSFSFFNNLILELPNIPIQVWVDQNWVGNYSQNYESQLRIGRHSLILRIAQSRRGSQVIYRNLYNGFIDIKPYVQLIGNCINYNMPIQFSEININENYSSNGYSNCQNMEGCPQNNQSFQYFLNSLDACWFESEKVELINQYLYANQLSSEQIYQVLAVLDYESSRLQVAKNAYSHCYDPQNYYYLFNLFSFSSSKLELSRFIGHC